jgi:hypothetical protein
VAASRKHPGAGIPFVQESCRRNHKSQLSCIVPRQLKRSVMWSSVHQALGLLVVITILKCNGRSVAQHSPSTDFASFLDSDSRYGKDFRIVQARLSESFRFADYNTTDTELFFSQETIRQAQVAVVLSQLFELFNLLLCVGLRI